MRRRAVIIGAGLGGLATAIRLAAQGWSVRVLEQNERAGGKVNLHRAAGYTFDTGASLLTMRHVLDDLFAAAGRRTEDYLKLEPLDPICRYAWTDGATFDASTNLDATRAEIRRIAPEDLEAFDAYLTDARRKYEVAERTFLAYPLNDLPRLLRPRYARDLAAISSLRTLASHTARHFRSPYLRQLFNRFATYNGSDPYRAPATFALIPWVEFGLGAWYVRGGMYELPKQLARVAEELGVEISTKSTVVEIPVENSAACGVRTSDGILHEADAVIANSDAIETYKRLIPAAARRVYTDRKLAKVEPSCSGFVLLFGVRGRYDGLAHHNIFFSGDYKAEFNRIFDEMRPAADPTIYVCATSRSDATQAPAGCENLFVLVNVPATSGRTDWAHEAQGYRDLIVKRLEDLGLDNLNAAIEYEHRITPDDFARDYGAHRGAIYGVSSNSITSAFFRPPNKARDIGNLYFAGGVTHPGGGIPLVLLSGKMAADLVERGSRFASQNSGTVK